MLSTAGETLAPQTTVLAWQPFLKGSDAGINTVADRPRHAVCMSNPVESLSDSGIIAKTAENM